VRRRFMLMAALAVLALALVAAGAVSAGGSKRAATSDTLVYAGSADPALLDPSLVSDGESLRATDQIFESLVGFKLGGTSIVPELATSWKASNGGLVWTFNLRKGVKFSDGTSFDANAVCFNFSRWFNFPAPLQNPALSYYWNTVFLGFRHPAQGSQGPDKALYKGCKAVNSSTVRLLLTRPSSSFLAAIGLPNFGIASPAALKQYKADDGSVDSGGVFHPTGTFSTRNPVGTGPYMLQSWTPGDKLVLVRNPSYWGKKAIIAKVIIRPIGDNAARLQALQTGEIQGYDGVAPEDFKTVTGNSKLQLLKRPPFSIGYIGINQSIAPMNNLLVRQAIAYAIDKALVVKAFYGGQGAVADQFLPPTLFGNAKSGIPQYSYDPAKAKALLQKAGQKLPLKVDFWYPTSVSRPYMPDPQRNFEAFAASMNKAGFQVTPHSAPWRPDYRAGVQAGKDELFLFGWIADFGDPADFLNVHFGSPTPQFGFKNQKLFDLLAKADAEPNFEKRVGLYEQASVEVAKFLPVIPYVWAGSAVAFAKNVLGFVPGPIGPVNEPFANLHFS
jgi:peptide/nickel transport system substrate-binding protein